MSLKGNFSSFQLERRLRAHGPPRFNLSSPMPAPKASAIRWHHRCEMLQWRRAIRRGWHPAYVALVRRVNFSSVAVSAQA